MGGAYILYRHALFARGLERLLRQQGVKVVGVSVKTRGALARIRKTEPDVVIIEAEKDKSDAEMLLFGLLREATEARLVRVSLEDNSVSCYLARRCTVSCVEDLADCVLCWTESRGGTGFARSARVQDDGLTANRPIERRS